jgi:uncharacterized protein
MAGRRPLVISVADLLAHPGTRRHIEIEEELDELALSESGIEPGETVRAKLTLESTGSAVVVQGGVQARWLGECRRCLGEVRGELDTHIREVFERHPTEGETYLLDGDEIDLEPVLRDAVLLALPIAPLCDEVCGGPEPEHYRVTPIDDAADAIVGRDADAVDPRWAALDELRGN